MMLISTRGRYALRILVDMAEHQTEGYIPLKEVAQRQEISEKYLEAIVKDLVKNNTLNGVRGKGGGYRLCRTPEQINVGEVLYCIEGSLAPVSCLEDGAAPCERASECRTLEFWRGQKKKTGREARFIPSGGQGENETMPEAEAIRQYLLREGIDDRLILKEDASKNTWQNMTNSKGIIQETGGGKTIFATTNYHVFRSGLWARQAGLNAEGIGSKTIWWFWPNAFMRETMGLLQKRWKQEILLLIVLIVFFGVLSLIL